MSISSHKICVEIIDNHALEEEINKLFDGIDLKKPIAINFGKFFGNFLFYHLVPLVPTY